MSSDNDISVDRSKCMYCGGCVSVCPKDAIFLDETIVNINRDECVKCGMCIKICPMGAINAGWYE